MKAINIVLVACFVGFILCIKARIITAQILLPREQISVPLPSRVNTNSVKCKNCTIDCNEPTIFSSCAKYTITYGCDIKDMCVTRKNATDREVYAGITMCILLGGCQVRANRLSVTDANYDFFISQSAEGVEITKLQKKINEAKSKIMSIVASNQREDEIFKLKKKTLIEYQESIEKIEENHILSTKDPFLQGKRRGLKIINASPSFFLMSLLSEDLKRDAKWIRQVLDRKANMFAATKASNIFNNELRKERRIVNAAKMVDLCKSSQYLNKKDLVDFGSRSGWEEHTSANTFKQMVMQYYVLQPLCKIPQVILAASGIVEDILDYNGHFKHDQIFNAIFASDQKLDSPIGYLHSALLKFASDYSNFVTTSSKKLSKTAFVEKIAPALTEVAEKYCSRVLCTYGCSDYVDDSVIKNCDRIDETQNLYFTIVDSQCSNGLKEAKKAEANYTSICQKSRSAETTFAVCFAQALHIGTYASNNERKRNGILMHATASVASGKVFHKNGKIVSVYLKPNMEKRDAFQDAYKACLTASKLGNKARESLTNKIVNEGREIAFRGYPSLTYDYEMSNVLKDILSDPLQGKLEQRFSFTTTDPKITAKDITVEKVNGHSIIKVRGYN